MVLHLVPGNPAQVIAGPDAPPETVRQIEVELGLDKPQTEQCAIYLGRVVLGRHVLLNMGGYGQYGTPVHRHGPAATFALASIGPRSY